MSLIQQIVELQNIDSNLQEISELLGDLPVKVEELKDQEDSLVESVNNAKVRIKELELELNKQDTEMIDFKEKIDKHKDQLRIDMDWAKEVIPGEYIIVHCNRVIDPNTYTEVYNDYFLKKYATALIKRQWGTNLLKFEGMVMPGGVTFNGRQLFDDANENV